MRIRPPSRQIIEAFRDWSSRLPETLGEFVVSGNEDFLIHIAVPDTDGLYSFVIDKLTERREVADVRTSVVYEHLRTQVVEPLVLYRTNPSASGGEPAVVGAGQSADQVDGADLQDEEHPRSLPR